MSGESLPLPKNPWTTGSSINVANQGPDNQQLSSTQCQAKAVSFCFGLSVCPVIQFHRLRDFPFNPSYLPSTTTVFSHIIIVQSFSNGHKSFCYLSVSLHYSYRKWQKVQHPLVNIYSPVSLVVLLFKLVLHLFHIYFSMTLALVIDFHYFTYDK